MNDKYKDLSTDNTDNLRAGTLGWGEDHSRKFK